MESKKRKVHPIDPSSLFRTVILPPPPSPLVGKYTGQRQERPSVTRSAHTNATDPLAFSCSHPYQEYYAKATCLVVSMSQHAYLFSWVYALPKERMLNRHGQDLR